MLPELREGAMACQGSRAFISRDTHQHQQHQHHQHHQHTYHRLRSRPASDRPARATPTRAQGTRFLLVWGRCLPACPLQIQSDHRLTCDLKHVDAKASQSLQRSQSLHDDNDSKHLRSPSVRSISATIHGWLNLNPLPLPPLRRRAAPCWPAPHLILCPSRRPTAAAAGAACIAAPRQSAAGVASSEGGLQGGRARESKEKERRRLRLGLEE